MAPLPRRLPAVALAITLAATPALAKPPTAAEERLIEVRKVVEHELTQRPEFQEARREAREARLAFSAARGAVLERVRDTTEYRRLLAEERAVRRELRALYHRYRHGIAPRDEARDFSDRILALSNRRSALEAEAIEADDAAVAAREDLVAAGRDYADERRWLALLIRDDPRFRAAMKAAGEPVR